jgi:catabolite repression HPr-like protein
METETKRVNAKSIMGMMSLEPAADEVIIISADGADEAEAVSELEGFLVENTAV